MEKYKLTKENVVMLFAGAALTFSLINCSSNKNEDSTANQRQAEEITRYYQEEQTEIVPEETSKEVENQTPEEPLETNVENQTLVESEEADQIIDDYITDLSSGFNELKTYASDQWNSEEFQAKLDICKEKLKNLLDFVFNGKEIDGITFNDLSDEAKANVMESLAELDEWIEMLFPNYKERIHDWFVRRGADGIELWNDLREGFSNYADEVMDEYNSRNATSHIKISTLK